MTRKPAKCHEPGPGGSPRSAGAFSRPMEGACRPLAEGKGLHIRRISRDFSFSMPEFMFWPKTRHKAACGPSRASLSLPAFPEPAFPPKGAGRHAHGREAKKKAGENPRPASLFGEKSYLSAFCLARIRLIASFRTSSFRWAGTNARASFRLRQAVAQISTLL